MNKQSKPIDPIDDKFMLGEDFRLVVFQTDKGELQIKVDDYVNTVWLTQGEIAKLFDKSVSTISEHITNIYKEEELSETETLTQLITQSENSENSFVKPKNYYSLDVVLSVGYKLNLNSFTRFE